MSQNSNTTSTSVVDEGTKARIANLGRVGTVLNEYSNGRHFESEINVALVELGKFADAVGQMGLSPDLRKGMDDLVLFLRAELDKRMRDTFSTAQQNF